MRFEPTEATEETSSTWHNPTEHAQTVTFHDTNPRGTKYTVPAGGTREIPSRYDFAIQKIECLDPVCRNSLHHLCMKGHAGVVMGGLAPALMKQGQTRSSHPLDPALDPAISQKRAAEAAQAAAMIGKRAHEEALILAKAAEMAADEKIHASKRSEEDRDDSSRAQIAARSPQSTPQKR